MSEKSCISGFDSAIASERKDRATCLLGLTGELIAGIPCAPLTPRRLEWLRAFNNPFICGGQSSVATMLQFLWFVSVEFCTDSAKRDEFLESNADIAGAERLLETADGISAYLDRAFLDAPHGKPGKPYYAPTVGLYHSLNSSYPHGEWTLAKVLDTPLAVIYQLIKVDDISNNRMVINRRSDEVAVKWAESLETITIPQPDLPNQVALTAPVLVVGESLTPEQLEDAQRAAREQWEAALMEAEAAWSEACKVIIEAHEQSVIDEIANRKAQGWLLMTQPSQNNDGSYSFAMQRKEES